MGLFKSCMQLSEDPKESKVEHLLLKKESAVHCLHAVKNQPNHLGKPLNTASTL